MKKFLFRSLLLAMLIATGVFSLMRLQQVSPSTRTSVLAVLPLGTNITNVKNWLQRQSIKKTEYINEKNIGNEQIPIVHFHVNVPRKTTLIVSALKSQTTLLCDEKKVYYCFFFDVKGNLIEADVSEVCHPRFVI